MTFEGLGEMFEGSFAYMHAEKFLLKLMCGLAEYRSCAYKGARTPLAPAEFLTWY